MAVQNNHKDIPVPVTLRSGIMERIARERQLLILRRKLVAFGAVSISSIIALIPAVFILRSEFIASGIAHYFSMIFSDGAILMSYWKDVLMMIAESLPIISMAMVFGILFVALWTTRNVVLNTKKIRMMHVLS